MIDKQDFYSNVTVIIPCYNDGQYIMEALQSLYDQTLLPEQIIIVDDRKKMKKKLLFSVIAAMLMFSACSNSRSGNFKAKTKTDSLSLKTKVDSLQEVITGLTSGDYDLKVVPSSIIRKIKQEIGLWWFQNMK